MTDDAKRYRAALGMVVALLEPLGWNHYIDDHKCQGCDYEISEALTYAMNAIAGIEPDAHLNEGPWIDHSGNVIKAATSTKEQRFEAWRKAGFIQNEKDPSIWHRGTAKL